MSVYFEYGDKELAHLKKVDKKLSDVINQVGIIRRAVNPDLFSALVNTIVGQQISSKAHQTIWERIKNDLEVVTPLSVNQLTVNEIQKFGISFRKAGYIKEVAQKVISNEFDIQALYSLSDEEVCNELSKLNGIGVWTAEMLMIFSMQRPNILSWGDLAIHRGLRMIYHHKNIDKELFNKYRKRFSPYATVASLYLWAVAGGAIDGMVDYGVNK